MLGHEDLRARQAILRMLEQVSKFYPTTAQVDPHYAVNRYLDDTGFFGKRRAEECHRALDASRNDISAAISDLSEELDSEADTGL